jgi:type II secretory pathway pseudopilin PulG
MDQLVLIVVGFLLTTVLGGLLGTYLQQRTWEHQNRARLREDELRRAADSAGPWPRTS